MNVLLYYKIEVRLHLILPAGLEKLEFTIDADTQMLKGKNASGVLVKALEEILLKGFKLSELSLSRFKLRCSENIRNEDLEEFGVIIIIIYNNFAYLSCSQLFL